MNLEVSVNIPEKTLVIDGKPMKLEETFTDASIDHPGTEDQALSLEYKGSFPEDDSPTEEERYKLQETYGKSLFDQTLVSPNMTEDAHYLIFTNNINASIQR